MPRQTIWAPRRALLLFLLFAVAVFLLQPRVAAQETESELLEAEQRLMQQIEEAAQQITQLSEVNAQLRAEQASLETSTREAKEAKLRRALQLSNDMNLFEGMKREMAEKQASLEKVTVHVNDLKTQVDELKTKVDQLSVVKSDVERKLAEPSLRDVLDVKSQRWSAVPRTVYNRTVTQILPAVSEMSKRAKAVKDQVSAKSRFLALLASLVIYGFVVGTGMVLVKVYRKVKGNLTVAKMLFLGDATCACFWYVVLICYLFLWKDPLWVIRSRNEILFFIFQLVALVSYVFYVFLRVITLAATLQIAPLGELLSVIIVGHHYYVRVWQPFMTDHPFHGTVFYYFCYAWLFSAFAHNRIQELAPLKQLQGPKLPIVAWIKVLISRFYRSDVPEGDVGSSSSSDSGSESGSESDSESGSSSEEEKVRRKK